MNDINVFVASSKADYNFIINLIGRLKDYGFVVFSPYGDMVSGILIKESLIDLVKRSEVILLLMGKEVSSSFYFEYGIIDNFKDKIVLPVRIDDGYIPPELVNILMIHVSSENVDDAAQRITFEISKAISRKAEQQNKAEVVQQRIERNAAQYIEPNLRLLASKESEERHAATIWQVVGFFSIVFAIIFAIYSYINTIDVLNIYSNSVWSIIFISGKGILIVVLFIAASKYAFDLGKSHMNEALKYSDRAHAISYGRFYLQVFGDDASWEDMKSVLENWNISADSSFKEISSQNFDPEILKNLNELVKTIASSKEGQNPRPSDVK